jgi:hypothetical protein
LIRTYHRFADWPLEALPPQEVPDKSSSTTGEPQDRALGAKVVLSFGADDPSVMAALIDAAPEVDIDNGVKLALAIGTYLPEKWQR